MVLSNEKKTKKSNKVLTYVMSVALQEDMVEGELCLLQQVSTFPLWDEELPLQTVKKIISKQWYNILQVKID